MEQPTGALGLETNTWERLDTAVRPPAATEILPPRSTATSRVAGIVEQIGGRLRSPGVTDRVAAADAVGQALQRAGEYLDRQGFEGIRDDAERLIVRRPVASVLLALVVGYIAGRAVWR